MHPVQSSNSQGAYSTITEEKKSNHTMQVTYSSKEMRDAKQSGIDRRDARKLSARNTFISLRRDKTVERSKAKQQSSLYRGLRSKDSATSPADRQRLSNPATRSSANPQIQELRKIHSDRFFATKIAEADKGADFPQREEGDRGASPGWDDRAHAASRQQLLGNSAPVGQDFCPATFYDLMLTMDTKSAKLEFHELHERHKIQFRQYYLDQNPEASCFLMRLLFP